MWILNCTLNLYFLWLDKPDELIDRTTHLAAQILVIPGLCVLFRRVILRRLQIELILRLGLIGIKPLLNGFNIPRAERAAEGGGQLFNGIWQGTTSSAPAQRQRSSKCK